MGRFVALDVETANAFVGSICQIGAVKFEDGHETDRMVWLVDPKQDFDPVNVSIHGITPQMVRGAPSLDQVHQHLADFVGDRVAVCHTHFDRVAFAQGCGHCGAPLFDWVWLDSAKVARRAWPAVAKSGFGLKPLGKMLGIEFRHHDAVEDAWAAGQVVLRALAESGLALEDWLDRCERPITEGKIQTRDPTGSGPFEGEVVVFTGALQMSRREASDRAAELGAVVRPSVTAQTTILVVGDQDVTKLAGHSTSAKQRKVEQMIADGATIRILAERDFLAIG